MVSQVLTQPFQRKQIIKELIDPGLASDLGEPTTNVTLSVEDISDLVTFVNMDAVTSKLVNLTVSQTNQNINLSGKEAFIGNCTTDLCPLTLEEPMQLYES